MLLPWTLVPVFGTLSTLLGHVSAAVVPRAYLVEFATGHNVDSFYNALATQHINVTPRLNMTYSLFNGSSFQLDRSPDVATTLDKIRSMPAVKTLWPADHDSDPAQAPTPQVEADHGFPISGSKIEKRQAADNSSYSPHIMTQVDQLHAKGITGKGIRVAIVDTGIDYKHPALGGCFGPGCLVSHGYDFIGETITNPDTGGWLPTPDDDPYDGCHGHGTHVAGIIAAQTNPLGLVGAAPGVELGAYRVATCAGNPDLDATIAAMNRAYDDGADIINLSLNFRNQWNEHPVSVTAQRIVERGVPVIAAMGNNGDQGLWSLGSPAAGLGLSGISNFINTETPMFHQAAQYTVDNTSEQQFGWHPGFPVLPTLSMPLYAPIIIDPNDACRPLPDNTPDLSQFVVLVQEVLGTSPTGCTTANKLQHASQKGAKYALVYRVADGPTSVIEASLWVQGVGMVTKATGEEWVRLLRNGSEVSVNITDPDSPDARQVVYSPRNTATGGLVAPRSSWGLTWELDVKPQFGAPGQNILSTWLMRDGGYRVQSGTSMASPLVTAIYALLMEARGTKDPATLQRLLSATAKPNIWYNSRTTNPDILAPVPQQGAGLVQAHDAALATVLLNVSSLAFNDSAHFPGHAAFTITNLGSAPVTYHLSHIHAATIYASSGSYTPDPAAFSLQRFDSTLETPTSWATLSFSPTTVTIPPGSTTTITITPTPPTSLDPGRLPVYSGYIVLNTTSPSTTPNLTLPYAGVAGPLYPLPVIAFANDTTAGFPQTYLGRWVEQGTDPVPENTTFLIPRPSGPPNAPGEKDRRIGYPTAVVTRKLGSRMVRIDVIALDGATNGTEVVLGREIVGSVEGYPLHLVEGPGDDTVPFSGMLSDGRVVPEGRYAFLARYLRLFGEVEREGDWIVEELPGFLLRYQAT
ncbi:subtilase [Podospora aff. communis PSN243]|uniref:Subtilase n=1 Tax=Podospora aff. communis PSN243 TaxID=3040156 RepID=A0AAV9GA57_9PEZI|nr:subtilase [Podospora aff. communis PSN243]